MADEAGFVRGADGDVRLTDRALPMHRGSVTRSLAAGLHSVAGAAMTDARARARRRGGGNERLGPEAQSYVGYLLVALDAARAANDGGSCNCPDDIYIGHIPPCPLVK